MRSKGQVIRQVARKLAHESSFHDPNVIHSYSSLNRYLHLVTPDQSTTRANYFCLSLRRFFWLFLCLYIGGCQMRTDRPAFLRLLRLIYHPGIQVVLSLPTSAFSSFVTILAEQRTSSTCDRPRLIACDLFVELSNYIRSCTSDEMDMLIA